MFVITKIIDGKNYRLCQDGTWRWFANFGTYPECVKEYRVRGFALRMAKRVKGKVLEIPPDLVMDAAGNLCSP